MPRMIAGWLVSLALCFGQVHAQTCNSAIPASTPDSRFTVSADGTANDNVTGLLWKRCAEGQSWNPVTNTCDGSAATFTWQGALQRAQQVNAGTAGTNLGYSSWRLPNHKELASLRERRCYSPTINETVFPGTPRSDFWSASPYAYFSDHVWFMNFDLGYVNSEPKNDSNRVRLVRGGQSFDIGPPVTSIQWPISTAANLPTITQDHSCRGTANLAAGSVDDACVRTDQHHAGLDIAAVAGTPVLAAAGGTVVTIQNACALGDTACNSGYGNTVIVQHTSGLYTEYAHLLTGSVTVTAGATVTQGQQIGQVGATGNVTGAHLHFEAKNHAGLLDSTGNYFAYTPTHPNSYGYLDPWAKIATTALTPTPVRIQNASGIYVRRGPGAEYSVFTQANADQRFVAFAKVTLGTDTWYRIHLPCGSGNSCAGWVAGSYQGLTYSVEEASATQVEVMNTGTAGLNARTAVGGSVIDKVFDGQRFVSLGTQPSGSGCSSAWHHIDLPMSSGRQTGWVCGDYVQVSGTASLLSVIQGSVTTAGEAPLSGVVMALSGVATASTTTLSGGTYDFAGLNNGAYTVTPSLSGYSFSPASRNVTTSGATYSGNDFRACSSTTPLTGYLLDATTGAALGGITVTAGGLSDVTDENTGFYSISGLACDTHTVTVSEPGSGYTSYSHTMDSFNGWSLDIQLTRPSTTNGLDTNSGYAADPVNTATGNYTYERRDLEIPGIGLPFVFTRAYNAQEASAATATDGPLGFGWTHNYNTSLSVDPAGNVTIRWGDGRTETYAPDGAGGFTPQYGVFDTLVDNGNGTYSLNRKDLSSYHFDTSGRLAAMVDKNGNGITLAYTGSDLTQVTDTAGRIITFTYDASHHLTRITDPIGRTVQFGYDPSGNLISATDPNGHTTAYSYDADHQMLTLTDPRGNVVVSNTYDSANRVVTYQEDAKGGATSYVYEELDRKTTITDALNQVTVHYHDPLLRLTKEIDARGMVALYEYDDRGNRVQVTDKNGNVTRYAYDDAGNVIQKTDALDHITTITYDPSNNPLSRTDAQGHAMTFTYDAQGNLIETRDAAGNTAGIAYDAAGLPLTLTDALGRVTTNVYDAQGNLVTVRDALGNETHYVYDGVGRRLSQTDALGHATTFAYDANNNLLSVTDADGNAVNHEYDGNNNRVRTTDRLGNVTSVIYDVKDLPVQATDPLGGTVITQYDALDRRVAITDQNGHTTQFAYDEVGNLISITDALGNVTTNVYDPNGNLLAVTDPLGHTSRSTYDALNRRVTASDALGNTSVTIYDALGQVVSTTNSKGQTTGFVYDVLGRLLLVTDAEGGTVRYEYDAVGNRMLLEDPNGNHTTYAYDALNRLLTKTEPLGNITRSEYDAVGNLTRLTKPNGTVVTYAYDNLNRLATVTYPDASGVGFAYDAEGRRTGMTDSLGTTQYGYDDLSRITQITDPFNRTIGYGYDAVGNRTSLTYPGSRFVTYSYDVLNRMTGVTDWLTRTTSYSYDAAGRLLQSANPNGTTASYAYDNADRLTNLTNAKADSTPISSYAYTLDPIGNHNQVIQDEPLLPVHTPGTAAYAYDAENRLTSVNGVPNAYDDNGNMTARGADGFAYDFEDRLVQSTIEGVASQYQYDGLGNRYAKTAGGVTTNYLLDTNTKLTNVLAELDASGNPQAYYVYGLGLVSRIETDGTTRYYHYDSRGSTVGLSDSAGTITDSYAYDAFGKVINNQGSSANPFRYIGGHGVADDGNGMQYVRARYYDSKMGRFITKDSLWVDMRNTGSLDKYVYVLNNPVILLDIDGYEPVTATLAGIAIVAIVAPWVGLAVEGTKDMNTNERTSVPQTEQPEIEQLAQQIYQQKLSDNPTYMAAKNAPKKSGWGFQMWTQYRSIKEARREALSIYEREGIDGVRSRLGSSDQENTREDHVNSQNMCLIGSACFDEVSTTSSGADGRSVVLGITQSLPRLPEIDEISFKRIQYKK